MCQGQKSIFESRIAPCDPRPEVGQMQLCTHCGGHKSKTMCVLDPEAVRDNGDM